MFRTLTTTGRQKRGTFRSFTKAAEPVCCTSVYTAERELAGGIKNIVGNNVNLFMSQAVTEGGTKPVSNGWLTQYSDLEFGKNKIVYGKEYTDPYNNKHTNVNSEQYIKVNPDGSATQVGNLKLNENGQNPVEFNKPTKQKTIKKINNANN